MKKHRFKEGDRIKRITPYHYAGSSGTDLDYGDQECKQGDLGTVTCYYAPGAYDNSEDSRNGLVLRVKWDNGASSAINEDCLDFELIPVTPDEEAAVIQSILKGASHG